MFCQCGCGGLTTVSKYDDPLTGYVKGQPRRFTAGHWHRWKRQQDRNWGKARADRSLRIATRVAKAYAPQRWEEAIGPAFEAVASNYVRVSGIVFVLEELARDAMRIHFTGERSYGASVDRMIAAGFEPVTT